MNKKTEPQVVGLKKLSSQAASAAIARLKYKVQSILANVRQLKELRKNPDPKFPSAMELKKKDIVEALETLKREYVKSGNSVRAAVELAFHQAINGAEEALNDNAEQGMGDAVSE